MFPHQISWVELLAKLDKHPGNVEAKEFKLACALTILTLEGFNNIAWAYLKFVFFDCIDELLSLREQLFDAMARFVWNLYDEEDLENVAFTDDIFNECERIWKLVYPKGNIELNLTLLDVSKYQYVREQDVCKLFMWCDKNKSPNHDELWDFSNFKRHVLLHLMFPTSPRNDFEKFVWKARDVMRGPYVLDPKGRAKHQLRMELNDCECFCIVDALHMHSWRGMHFEKLEEVVSGREKLGEVDSGRKELEGLVEQIQHIFYDLVVLRRNCLHRCERLVTYPLSGGMFGSWDIEVKQVVRCADLKRRSEGRRFIGTDHLLFCLDQMLVSESGVEERSFISLSAKQRVSSSSDDEEKEKHKEETVYHLYQKAYEIATELGHETIGMEHLYVAITSTNDDKSSWKDSVECVRLAKTERKAGKCKEPHMNNLWEFITEDGKRSFREGTFLEVVKKMKDESNTYLQNAIRSNLGIV